jgi:peptide-methionine (S)-S-oxide reductase|tara:strand:+ start:800 stop:1357 length:558 start_codon:yes stop_codon:yes gene_type:complete
MQHFLSGLDLQSDCPQGCESIVFGAGCFWGVEKKFWSLDGVWLTSVGYSGGTLENPSYQEVCSGTTDHVEVVKVIFDPDIMPVLELLKVFWECHDPTQGMRQGNDVGSQYRSVIFVSSKRHEDAALSSLQIYQAELKLRGFGPITTEISAGKNYYLAEEYHQQYLAKNPNGYCGLGGTGCSFPKN